MNPHRNRPPVAAAGSLTTPADQLPEGGPDAGISGSQGREVVLTEQEIQACGRAVREILLCPVTYDRHITMAAAVARTITDLPKIRRRLEEEK